MLIGQCKTQTSFIARNIRPRSSRGAKTARRTTQIRGSSAICSASRQPRRGAIAHLYSKLLMWLGIWLSSLLLPALAQPSASTLVPPASIATFEQVMNSALLPLLLANAAMLLLVLLVFSLRQQHSRQPCLLVRFIQSQSTPYWIADANGIIQHANPALSALCEWQKGVALSLYHDAEGTQAVWSHLQRLGLGNEWQGFVYVRHHDGSMAGHYLKITPLRAYVGEPSAPLLCQFIPADMHDALTGTAPPQIVHQARTIPDELVPAEGTFANSSAPGAEFSTPGSHQLLPHHLLIFIHTDVDTLAEIDTWLRRWRGFSDSQLSLDLPISKAEQATSPPTYCRLKLSRCGPALPLLPLAVMLESLQRPSMVAALDITDNEAFADTATSHRLLYQQFTAHVHQCMAANANPSITKVSRSSEDDYPMIAVATDGEFSAWARAWIERLRSDGSAPDIAFSPPPEPAQLAWQAHFKVLQALLRHIAQQPVSFEYQKCYHLERGLVQRFQSRWQWPWLDVASSPRLSMAMSILHQLLPEPRAHQGAQTDEPLQAPIAMQSAAPTTIYNSDDIADEYTNLCQLIRSSAWWLRIERHAFEQLCQHQQRWQQQFLPVPVLAWQWSAAQLLTTDFAAYLATILGEYDTKPLDWHWCWREDDVLAVIHIEPSASLSQLPSLNVAPRNASRLAPASNSAASPVFSDSASSRLQAALQQLSDAGHCMVLDSFAEHAGQLDLLQWPVFRRVRFAARFSEQLEYSERIRHLNASLIRMASYLRLDVDVSGVPNEMTAYLLHVMGAQLGSGHYFSAWLGEDDILEWLRQERQQPQRLTG